jgi:hypothetical protein
MTPKFSLKKRYVRTDGWRGYEEPIYAVCGANDTGGWEDSPCPSHVGDKELKAARQVLKGIPVKRVACNTSNVFCIHKYLVVPIDQVGEARARIKKYLSENETQLLYAVDCS